VEFRVLGPLEVVNGDEIVALGGSRERALLALLLLSPNQVVSSDRVVDEIWGGRTSEGAIHTLRVTMSRLRKALGAAGGDGGPRHPAPATSLVSAQASSTPPGSRLW